MDFFEIHGWDSSTGASAARGGNFAPKPPVVPVAPAACAGLVKREGESWVIHETRVIFWELQSQFQLFFDTCFASHSVKFGQSLFFFGSRFQLDMKYESFHIFL